ncbi:MAG: LemA family protein [Clostridia bacterium]|jgi:LemA protein
MGWIIPIVVIVVIVILGLWVAGTFNGLIGRRNKVTNQWAQVDVQLKRRFDLIPNLVETVKGYATHERTTFEQVTEARTKYMSAQTPADKMDANAGLAGLIGKLFAVAEDYPELKANVNFINLQDQLTETEDKISFARQFYNDTVMDYNNTVQMFPSSIIANMFAFKMADFFKSDETEKEAPAVKF